MLRNIAIREKLDLILWIFKFIGTTVALTAIAALAYFLREKL